MWSFVVYFACLLVCVSDRLLVCSRDWLFVCSFVCSLVSLPAWLVFCVGVLCVGLKVCAFACFVVLLCVCSCFWCVHSFVWFAFVNVCVCVFVCSRACVHVFICSQVRLIAYVGVVLAVICCFVGLVYSSGDACLVVCPCVCSLARLSVCSLARLLACLLVCVE